MDIIQSRNIVEKSHKSNDCETQPECNSESSTFNCHLTQQNSEVVSVNAAEEYKNSNNDLQDNSCIEIEQSEINGAEENLLENEKNEVDSFLTTAIIFRGQDQRVCKMFEECLSHVELMKKLNEEVENSLDTCSSLQTEVQEWELKLKNLQSRMMRMLAVLPDSTNENEASSSFLTEDKSLEVNEKISEDLVKLSLNDCVSPVNNKSPHVAAPVCKSPQPCVDGSMSLLTSEEFENIPTYSRGRMTLNDINEFITVLNSMIARKYKLVSCNISTLSDKDIELRNSLLHVEVRETKGVYFITPEDLRLLGAIKMSKRDYLMLIILRQAKRIKENRVGKFISYEIIT